MEEFKEKFCMFCLNTMKNTHFETIEKDTIQMLEVLLNRDLDHESKYLMCSACSLKLLAAFKFKLTTVYIDNTIKSYADSQKMLPLDLRDIYGKEKGNRRLSSEFSDHLVCRLCMQLVRDEFASFHKIESDLIHPYIPELDFSVTEDPIICKLCLDSLTAHTRFIKNCLDSMEKRNSTDGNNDQDIKPNVLLLDSYVKTEEIELEYKDKVLTKAVKIRIETETDEQEKSIKCEEIEMESEGSSEDSPQSGHHPQTLSDTSVTESNTKNDHLTENIIGYKCCICEYQCSLRKDMEAHVSIHKNPRDLYKCNSCSYMSDSVQNVERHILVHKDPSEIQTCICRLCKDRPKPKKKERRPPEKKEFKCNLCGFVAKRRYPFEMHEWSHRDPSQRPFQCDLCEYRAKSQSDVKKHRLKHIDRRELDMFKCTSCDFEARIKSDLKKHISRRHSSEHKTYKCYLCEFETKYKYNLEIHVFNHKDVAESRRFMCDVCGHKLKTKRSLQIHQLKHTKPSDLQLFVCSYCQYQAKYRERLAAHIKMCPAKKVQETHAG